MYLHKDIRTWLRDEEASRLASFWPYKGAQQRQTTNDAEYVFAGKPACALVLAEREYSYGSDASVGRVSQRCPAFVRQVSVGAECRRAARRRRRGSKRRTGSDLTFIKLHTAWPFGEREGVAEVWWERVRGGEGVLAGLKHWRPGPGRVDGARPYVPLR